MADNPFTQFFNSIYDTFYPSSSSPAAPAPQQPASGGGFSASSFFTPSPNPWDYDPATEEFWQRVRAGQQSADAPVQNPGRPVIPPTPLNRPASLGGFSLAPARAEAPQSYFGPSVNVNQLPAGMRNNNPGNLKYTGSAFQRMNYAGMIGPSQNRDEGAPQIVFSSPEDGMTAAVRLAKLKFNAGLTTVNSIITHPTLGWTPNFTEAAKNISKMMGVGVNATINLNEPAQMHRFMRALITQEHGPDANRYRDDLITRAIGRVF